MTTTATFDFDAREYYRAIRAVQGRGPSRWLVLIAGIIVPAVMIWLAVGEDWQHMTPWFAFQNALPWLLLSAFVLSLLPLVTRSAAKKALESDPSLRGPQTSIVDDDGVHVLGTGFRQDFRWSDVVEAVETREFFLFFYDKQQAAYLPKRSLASPEIADVQHLIGLHAPASRGSTLAPRAP